MAGGLSPEKRALFDVYANALAEYRRGHWSRTEAALREALSIAPDDGPSLTLLSRLGRFKEAMPAEWDGVWRMTEK